MNDTVGMKMEEKEKYYSDVLGKYNLVMDTLLQPNIGS